MSGALPWTHSILPHPRLLAHLKPIAAALSLLLCAAASAPSAPPWADFKTPEKVTIKGYNGHVMEAALSRDGEILFFNNRNYPPRKTDLHWAQRIDDLTFAYQGLLQGANSKTLDGVAAISKNNQFCFITVRDYARTFSTVYCGIWIAGKVADAKLHNGASLNIPGRVVFDIDLNQAGDELILADGTFAKGSALPVASDLKLARLDRQDYRLSAAEDSLFANINTAVLEYAPATSADGLELAFTRGQMTGKKFVTTVWIAQRPTQAHPYGPPVRIAAITGDFAEAPTFTPDAKALYFHRMIKGKFSLWRVER